MPTVTLQVVDTFPEDTDVAAYLLLGAEVHVHRHESPKGTPVDSDTVADGEISLTLDNETPYVIYGAVGHVDAVEADPEADPPVEAADEIPGTPTFLHYRVSPAE